MTALARPSAKATLPLPSSQLCPYSLLVQVLELFEPVVRLQRDLELAQVEIRRVAEALEQLAIHDLGQRLVTAADASVR